MSYARNGRNATRPKRTIPQIVIDVKNVIADDIETWLKDNRQSTEEHPITPFTNRAALVQVCNDIPANTYYTGSYFIKDDDGVVQKLTVDAIIIDAETGEPAYSVAAQYIKNPKEDRAGKTYNFRMTAIPIDMEKGTMFSERYRLNDDILRMNVE